MIFVPHGSLTVKKCKESRILISNMKTYMLFPGQMDSWMELLMEAVIVNAGPVSRSGGCLLVPWEDFG